MVHNKDWG